MFCTQCGSRIIPKAKFCSYCGYSVAGRLLDGKQVPKRIEKEIVYPHAGFLLRFWAFLIDLFVIGIPYLILSSFHEGFRFINFLIGVTYFAGMESSALQGTIGKRVIGIVVTNENGQRISFSKALGRFFAKYLSSFTVIGLLMVGWTKKKQALHDYLAKSIVIKKNEKFQVVERVVDFASPSKPIASSSNIKTSGVGSLSRKVKKGISSLPIVTALGDVVLGASGLDELQKRLQTEPKNPLYWLFYYEAFVTYGKVRAGVNVARLVFNPVGFAVSQGVSVGLNVMDDQFAKFKPQTCLDAALSLAQKNVRTKKSNSRDLLVIGKTLYYKGINELDDNKKNNYFKQSIYYLSSAIEIEQNQEWIAEYFFYLAQVYQQLNNEELRCRALNLSRKLGFAPSLELLRSIILLKKGVQENITQNSPCMIQEFKFTYNSGDKLEKAVKFTVNEQGKKLVNTSKRIKKFLDT